MGYLLLNISVLNLASSFLSIFFYLIKYSYSYFFVLAVIHDKLTLLGISF
jgi:hypothetical protein